MTSEMTFSASEREAIDRADAELRKLVPAQDKAETGFPYARHHRIARNELRDALGGRAPSRHRQIAGLLLQWARENGDIRLYVYRPYAVCAAESGVTDLNPAWEDVRNALAAAGSFEEFVSRQARET